MRAAHTPTPWRVLATKTHSHEIHAGESPLGSGLVCMMQFHPAERDIAAADARRIVACVNACAGLATEDLESIAATGGMLGPREDVARIATQRDHLVTALKSAAMALDLAGLVQVPPGEPEPYWKEQARAAARGSREALVNVTGAPS